jgi:hypothetical protein
MKRQLLLSVLCLLLVQACVKVSGDASSSISLEDEKAAILKAIENETRSFYLKDHTKWSESFVHSSKVHWVCVEPDVTLRASGWDDLSQFVAGWMKENPQPMDYEKSKFENSNVQVTIEGNTAFVSMNGSNIQPDGTTRYTTGSRTMLKENGVWKILSMTSYPSDSPAGSTVNVYVHKATLH